MENSFPRHQVPIRDSQSMYVSLAMLASSLRMIDANVITQT